MASHTPAKPLTPRPNSKSNIPSSSKSTLKKTPAAKVAGKPNASILSFFKKVDSPLLEESIFVAGPQANVSSRPTARSPATLDSDDDLYGIEDKAMSGRFNESTGSVKRRKISSGSTTSGMGSAADLSLSASTVDSDMQEAAAGTCTPPPPELLPQSKKAKKARRRGPFLSDSDTDEETSVVLDNQAVQQQAVAMEKKDLRDAVSKQPPAMNTLVTTRTIDQAQILENRPVVPSLDSVVPSNNGPRMWMKVPVAEAQAKWEAMPPKNKTPSPPITLENPLSTACIPGLKKENTTVDEWDGFEDDDFQDIMDELGDGEEFVERKWMEEQARLEADEQPKTTSVSAESIKKESDEIMSATCPICDASLDGITPDDASKHVNGCLDGKPIPLPERVKVEPSEIKYMPPEASSRFRKAAIARPGQANPFEIGGTEAAPSSAFSKLMSGHAEDAAWATAAAAEHSSRGKPAYQRTCPFYKIMPGFFICVDAFRYGAVEGCKAYFLSHFHSDHYVGLTSTWCHGPIYCSKVTGNLVKQQLKVDPKWVVSLDFEERFEVPGTEGVAVTMIPANHCPGSSLYLFEKPLGRGRNAKFQRVLHCGDFRACPAHIEHPLLMPNIVDSISGKTKQQKIDVCYLDTTYLNPKYAFPSQGEVITACAEMCVSLTKERAEENDAWESVKRERAGTGMQKFIHNPTLKAEDSSLAMEIGGSKPRGRLLVVCGTYSIGKERICMGIARALDCKIWAPPGKMRICAALEDPELMSRMTNDPKEAQIHMQMLMELRPETLNDYLTSYKPHFTRVVGFRPSGWNYRPPNSRYASFTPCL